MAQVAPSDGWMLFVPDAAVRRPRERPCRIPVSWLSRQTANASNDGGKRSLAPTVQLSALPP
jgi:hypothetical protein